MKNKTVLIIIFSMLLLLIFQTKATAQKVVKIKPKSPVPLKSWSHIEYKTQTEVLQFINGEKANAPEEFRVTAVGTTNGGVEFHVFYQSSLMPALPKPDPLWVAKRFNSEDEALTFINSNTGKEIRICGAKTTNLPKSFFLFYRDIAGSIAGGWAWKLSDTADDVKNFLSREGGYTAYIREADVATLDNKFYIFFRPAPMLAPPNKPFPGWGWVKRETNESAAQILNNGTSNVKKMMTVARIGASRESGGTVFYIFYQ
jgi:hypothetical protein